VFDTQTQVQNNEKQIQHIINEANRYSSLRLLEVAFFYKCSCAQYGQMLAAEFNFEDTQALFCMT